MKKNCHFYAEIVKSDKFFLTIVINLQVREEKEGQEGMQDVFLLGG